LATFQPVAAIPYSAALAAGNVQSRIVRLAKRHFIGALLDMRPQDFASTDGACIVFTPSQAVENFASARSPLSVVCEAAAVGAIVKAMATAKAQLAILRWQGCRSSTRLAT